MMVVIKRFKLLMPLTFTLLFTSSFCQRTPPKETPLVALSNRILKGLPEFIGCNFNMTNEMKTFYASSVEWNLNPYTLKYNDLDAALYRFISGFRNDTAYKDSNKWVNKIPPPNSIFDFSQDQPNIFYPYIQKVVVPAQSTIFFMSDIHASPHTLLRTLWRWRLDKVMDSNFKLKSNCYFVFHGDYVDFGNGGSEVWNILSTLKLNNWRQVFMLRGNHELWPTDHSATHSTFFDEVAYKFGESAPQILENKIKCAYNLLPHALLIGTANDYILCAHGGADATYNAANLLKSGNFYEYLSAQHNFAYGNNVYGGWSNNRFIGRIYSDDPATKPIETDVNSLPIQYSRDGKRTHIIMRGHQHGEATQCFCFIKNGYPVGTNPNTTILPSWQAPNNVSAEDQRLMVKGLFKMNNLNYYPLYSFFSATGNSTRYDCFAKIKVADDFSNWTFEIDQQDLDTSEQFLRNFARFELFNRNNIKTVYSRNNKPFALPLSVSLRNM